jgi:two-component sensor histidine kinase
MLLILSLWFLPLGLIAMLASIQSARENNQRRAEQVQLRVETKAQRLNWTMSRAAITLRAASEALIEADARPETCEMLLRKLAALQITPGRYALFAGGDEPVCRSAGYGPPRSVRLWQGKGSNVEISENGDALNVAVFGPRGEIQGVAELPRAKLSVLSYIPGTTRTFNLELVHGNRRMLLSNAYRDGPLVHTVRGEAPLAGGRLLLRMTLADTPVTLTEFLMMGLPLLMWAGAAIIGWFIVDRLILKPLAGVQRAVASYQPGDREFALPRFRTPSKEIGDLGSAFDRVTRTVASHEAELEAAVERQKRLVREVHHRVKNNLQVVASLLNLHSRGSPNEDVAAAYASIQRRVDALAVVHRNHFAELEDNRGVSLRSLISELGANLRATAPASAANMPIRLDIEPFYVNQDVAVSVAFLITEFVEFAMFCGARPVTIALNGSADGAARLTIVSDSLKGEAQCEEMLIDRFNRIVTGLSRQLRSTIERDENEGRFSLDIAVLDKAER